MLYRLLSSLKTSVFILSFMCLIFLIGTVFPQGEEIEKYIEAGGKYVTLVSALDFLDIFFSPLFIFVTGILLINLAVCLYDRLKLFAGFKRKPLDVKSHPGVVTIEKPDVEDRLAKIGFKLKAETDNSTSQSVKMFEKGLQYWWLSWLYHVGIILAVFGFFITALFAFEKGVILYPDKPNTISLYSEETRWNKFLRNIGVELPEKRKEDEYVLTLKEFKTEYYQGLRIDYPEAKLERLALGIGIKKIMPSEKGFYYRPKMWLTRLDIKKHDGEILDAELWVNKPFRLGNLTLYQMGYQQKARLFAYPIRGEGSPGPSNKVNGETIDVDVRIPFQVKGIRGKFVLGSLKLGMLFKKDGTTEEITPVTTIYYISEESPNRPEALGELRLGRRINAKGVVFEFRDYKEASYLSYRKDPGVWIVGLACLFVFLGLFVRSLGAWYRVQYTIEKQTAYVLISSRGILADKDRVIKRLQM